MISLLASLKRGLRASSPGEGRQRASYLFFATSLILLITLAIWWGYAMLHAVESEYHSQHQVLLYRTGELALSLQRPRVGIVPGAPDFEIVPFDAGLDLSATGRLIEGERLWLRPTSQTLDELDAWRRRRTAMVLGEGGLLMLLLGICIAMLFRLVLAERRTHAELELFMGRVTHEMKTPLAGLKALLQTVKAGRIPTARLAPMIDMGLRQIEREERLIQNLLTAQRVDRPQHELRVEALPLAPFLERFTAHRVQHMLTEEDRYQVIAPDALVARADRDALRTILENLCDNADKYGARQLTLRVGSESGRATLSCEDDGDGFAPEDAESLFAAYKRAHNGTWKHGTGLGLYLSRRLARAMGGDLRAESAGIGQGARFTLTLPLHASGTP